VRTAPIALAAGLVLVLGAAWIASRALGPRAPEAALAPAGAGAAAVPAGAGGPDLSDPRSIGSRAPAAGSGERSEAGGPPAERAPDPDGLRAPVHLLLVDQRTAEPVGDFSVEIRSLGGIEERTSSDPAGELRSATAFAPGALRAVLYDLPRDDAPTGLAVPFEHAGLEQAQALELAIPIGPTYRVELKGAGGVPLEWLGARLRLAGEALRSADAEHLVPLRPGPPSWVRFGRGAARPGADAAHWTLEVQSRDGLWRGAAPVDSVVGIYPEVVSIELAPCALLKGRATFAGRGVSGVEVALRKEDDAGVLRVDRSSKDGTFEVRWLAPGAYALTATSAAYARVEARVLVERGGLLRHDLTLAPKPIAGTVSGRLTSLTGGFGPAGSDPGGEGVRRSLRISLRATDGAGSSRATYPLWEEVAGRRVGRFEFRDVPEGEYELSPARYHNWSWEPERVVLTAPREGIEFVLQDAAEAADLALVATDATTGGALDGLRLHFSSARGPLTFDGLRSGAVFLQEWPDDLAFEWILERDGYAPARGDATGAAPGAGQGPRRRTIEAALERGWGTTLVVVGLDQRAAERPLAGVRVLVDGDEAGVSDERGQLVLCRAARPARIAVEAPGWRPAGGDLDPTTGRFEPRAGRVLVRMARPR